MSAITAHTPASRPSDWLLRQLPSGMLSDDFFVRFVSLFQAEADTLLEHADGVQHLGDVKIAPAAMVRYLAQWIGAPPIDPDLDEEQQRVLVLAMARALPHRGTTTGLRYLIEAWTGSKVVIEESGGVFEAGQAPIGPAWVRITMLSTGRVGSASLAKLVLEELPAHVRVELWVGSERVWVTPGWPGAPARTGGRP